jgi:D-alanyl-D-alanine carboxypeptidase
VAPLEDLLAAVVATRVPGAVAVSVGPGGRVQGAAGLAALDADEPLGVEQRFRIGSLTKIFVAALVLRLVEKGLLDLDGAAAPFVEDVTIRQLLNHTSGLDDFPGDMLGFFEPWRADPAHPWELDTRDELRLVLEKPRLFPPGQGWAYHGSNYLVLRLLVEQATGMGLRDALQERVFAPLGLERTGLVEAPLRGDCAHGYLPVQNPILPGGPEPVDVTELDLPFYRAGGGIVSTAGAVAAMLGALLGDEFLTAPLRRELLDAVESDWEETTATASAPARSRR